MNGGCFADVRKMFHDEARNHFFVISSEGGAGVEKSAAQLV